eukprot:14715423-Ditylum_brightwellii.AAC.1
MKDQQQHPPMSAPNETLERALENMLETTCLQAEATNSSTEESRKTQEEKGQSDNKFAQFGNKPTENCTA